MITEVILPKMGQTMEEGTIVEWVKQEGDPVKRGEVLFTMESDKATLEVEATARGFLRKVLMPAGQTVPVLTVVALITRKADEDISGYEGTGRQVAIGQVASRQGDKGEAVEPASQAAEEVEPARPEGSQRVFASPRARKTARAKGVDLALVTGSGPNGRIVEQDVLDYAATRPKVTPMAARTAGISTTPASRSSAFVRSRRRRRNAMASGVTNAPAPK